jgi:hypothetical protein
MVKIDIRIICISLMIVTISTLTLAAGLATTMLLGVVMKRVL